jgi:cytochrome c biogenesis protein CcdA
MLQRSRWQDWLLTAGGAYVFVTPWVFDFTATNDAAWTAWIVGGAIALLGLVALTVPRFEITEWTQVLAGALLFVAPWVFGYETLRDPAWNAWIAGPAAVVLAAWAIYDGRKRSTGVEEKEIRYPRAA